MNNLNKIILSPENSIKKGKKVGEMIKLSKI